MNIQQITQEEFDKKVDEAVNTDIGGQPIIIKNKKVRRKKKDLAILTLNLRYEIK